MNSDVVASMLIFIRRSVYCTGKPQCQYGVSDSENQSDHVSDGSIYRIVSAFVPDSGHFPLRLYDFRSHDFRVLQRRSGRVFIFPGIPVMFGASLLKIVKFGRMFTGPEIGYLLIGMATSFVVSILSIKFLLSYVRKNDFKFFGYYRIVLGVTVFAYFGISSLMA